LTDEVYRRGWLSARPCAARGPLAVQGLDTCARSFSLPLLALLSLSPLARKSLLKTLLPTLRTLLLKLRKLLLTLLSLQPTLLQLPAPMLLLLQAALLLALRLLQPTLLALLRLLPPTLLLLLRTLPRRCNLRRRRIQNWARRGYLARPFLCYRSRMKAR
jgi:hypothetical protein